MIFVPLRTKSPPTVHGEHEVTNSRKRSPFLIVQYEHYAIRKMPGVDVASAIMCTLFGLLTIIVSSEEIRHWIEFDQQRVVRRKQSQCC